MLRLLADVVNIVEHDEPIRRWAADTVFETLSDGVGVRHVRHQPASPCINVHVGPWRQREGLSDAVRVVRLVDTKAMQEAGR